MFGALLIIALFLYFLLRGIYVSTQNKEGFHANLGHGLAVAISLQALFNIAIACRVLPPTGITLPFFSTGGSSLVITIVMCALLLNVSKEPRAREVGGRN